MALFSRLFSSRRNTKRDLPQNGDKNDRSSWKPSPFSKEQVRLLLFRECEIRGRKLLFDSDAVQKVSLEQTPCKMRFAGRQKIESVAKDAFVEATNGYGYKYTKPSSDATLLGEMMFGAVAMTYRGAASKVHSLSAPHRLMCTKVFPSPLAPNSRTLEDSFGSSINSINEFMSSGSDTHLGSGPLDVPTAEVAEFQSSLTGDSGICGDFSLHSISSIGSNYWTPIQSPESNNSYPSFDCPLSLRCSGGSLSSLQRRWLRNRNTSLETIPSNSVQSNGSSRQRRTKLGVAVIITLSEEHHNEMSSYVFERMSLVDAMVERLRCSVERAYSRKDVFVHAMHEAWSEVQQTVCDMLTLPRLERPMWLQLGLDCTADERTRKLTATSFLQDLCHLVATLDTKATNFFVSTLLTGVLTHHLGWVNTVWPVHFPHAKDNTTRQSLNDLSKSHPYNPLWAQLSDLYGALGSPTKVSKTIVTSNNPRKTEYINKLLTVITYFIRCGEVKESRLNPSDVSTSEVQVAYQKQASTVTLTSDGYKKTEDHSLKGSCSVKCLTVSLTPEPKLSEPSLDTEKRLNVTREILEGKKTGNFCSPAGAEWREHQEVDVRCSLPSIELCDVQAGGLKRTSSCREKMNSLYPKIDELAKMENIRLDEVYVMDNVSIEDKVSKLCRVPTSAIMFHLDASEKIHVQPKECFNVSKCVDVERQTSAANRPDVVFVLGEEKVDTSGQKVVTVKSDCIDMETEDCRGSVSLGRSSSVNLPIGGLTRRTRRRRTEISCDECRSDVKDRMPIRCNHNAGNFHRIRSEKVDLNLLDPSNDDPSEREGNALYEQFNPSDEEMVDRHTSFRLVELPLPSCLVQDSTVLGVASSLLGGVSNRYIPDLVLQGCTSLPAGWEAALRRDLALTAKMSDIGQDITEAVCLVANTQTWEVQLVSSHSCIIDKPGTLGVRVGMSQLVANMLESLSHLYRLKTPPEHCLSHLENKLTELLLRSQALAELLSTTEFCSMELLTTSLDLEANDVPLLLAIATTHSPHIAQRYGLSFV